MRSFYKNNFNFMNFSTQNEKDLAIVEAQKVVDTSHGQALVDAKQTLADTKAAEVR